LGHFGPIHLFIKNSPQRNIRKTNQARKGTGDPISPMLFILAMDPLHKLLQRAAESGILSLITPRSSEIKVSLYADDTAIFAKPTKNDLGALKEILDMFRRASGLRTNLQKTEIFSICCGEQHLQEILDVFPVRTGSFPCRYLGLPLHIKKLCKLDYLPLLEKVGGKLPG
jgi:hypothetical protein